MTREERKKFDWCKTHRVNEYGVIERVCSGCGEWLEETLEYYYYKNKSKPQLGFSGECKVCASKRARKVALKNPERTKINVERWQKENLIRYRQVRKEYNDTHKEKIYQDSLIWQRENPDKLRTYNKQHRIHDITDAEWKACKSFFDNKCAYCGLPIESHLVTRNNKIINMELHQEHVDDDGANDLSNCVPSCQSCNSSKANKTIEEFLEFNLVKEFDEFKYNKILEWICDEYKKYIEPKPPYRIIREQNEGQKTYHFQLWSVDEKRNQIDCLARSDKKNGLDKYIQEYFNT